MFSPIFFYTQQDMFTYADASNHSFFFAVDKLNGGKCYSSAPSIKDFIPYYQSIPDPEKWFYEIVRYDHSFYEFYDLDLKLTDKHNKLLYTNENLFLWFDSIRSEFLTTYINASQKFKSNWIIITATNQEKLSLHLINTNTAFVSHELFKHYYSLFKQYIINFIDASHPFRSAIDFCVSSSNRCMRLCLSSKINTNRPLKVWSEFHTTHISLEKTFITNSRNDPLLYKKYISDDDFDDNKKDEKETETKRKNIN